MKLRPKGNIALAIAGTVGAVIWCFHRRNPHLLNIRHYETSLLVALAAVSALSICRLSYRNGRTLLFMINLAVVGYVLIDDVRFAYLRKKLLTHPPAAARVINKRLIVGFDSDEQAAALARHGIAGLFITRNTLQGLSFAHAQSKLAHLQDLRRATGHPPLILATDQEGGVVSRLTPPLSARPALSTLAAHQDRETLAYTYGREQGRELRELGITVNFSPVVDLLPLQPPSPLDRHTKIGQRAIADDPKVVTQIARAYVAGLQESGVTAVLKHFPGLQKVPADTHHFSADLTATPATLMHNDWLPFREIAAHSQAWIMLSHVRLTTVDPVDPVSMSKRVIDQLLRNELSLRGPLVTDDLTMGAAYNRGFCRSVTAAYATTVDYLLISFDTDKYVDAMQCLLQNEASVTRYTDSNKFWGQLSGEIRKYP